MSTASLSPAYIKSCIREYRHAMRRQRARDSARLASAFLAWAGELGVATEDRGVFPIAFDVLAKVEERDADRGASRKERHDG